MEDELEDLIFIQFYHSAMKVLSRFSLSNPFNSVYSGYAWRMARLYLLKPEVLIATLVLCLFFVYFQVTETWSRTSFANLRINLGFSKPSLGKHLSASPAERQSWELRKSNAVAYSIQGRRPKQEDRFVIEENINSDTGVSFFAIFDGHGGDFAAEFAKDVLVQNLLNKITESANIVNGKVVSKEDYAACPEKTNEAEAGSKQTEEETTQTAAQRRKSFKKTKTEDFLDEARASAQISTNDLLMKLNALSKPITKEDFLLPGKPVKPAVKPKVYEAKCYIENNSINFGKMMTDEVLAADYRLVELAKKDANIAGSTAIMMIIHDQKLIVANVGDSRAVMCDAKGTAIALSFDHKPQQVREHKRIHDAGGFIAFRGVWRVAGILATSRALGDYPLKDRNLVIADPDILTFDLKDHRPQFIIIASDGLWDTFTNEEAVAFIKDRLDEPHFGAKSIVLQSYNRGSVDNITVIVVVFKNGRYQIGTSE